MNTKYISVKEAVDETGYHADYIRKMIREGKIVAEKKGAWWIHIESLNEYRQIASEAAVKDKRFGSK